MMQSFFSFLSVCIFFYRNSKSSFQAGRKPASKFQAQPITDVSITVPGVQKQPGLKINKTNQVRDARDRLSAKAKTGDAREKLNQKAQSTDARQKLLNIRAQKGQGPGGAVDARVKLQAKRIQGGAQGQGPPGALNLTRTVSGFLMIIVIRDLTRILKIGVRDSSKRKSRSPRQNLGVPL